MVLLRRLSFTRSTSRRPRFHERRAKRSPEPSALPLSALKALFSRPIHFTRVGDEWRFVIVDRRKARPEDHPAALKLIGDELRDRLKVYGRKYGAARPLRNLGLVQEALTSRGWNAVALMPAAFLKRAQLQARALAGRNPSDAMRLVVARLGSLHDAAQRQEQASVVLRQRLQEVDVDVSDTSFEAFAQSAAAWSETEAARLDEAAGGGRLVNR